MGTQPPLPLSQSITHHDCFPVSRHLCARVSLNWFDISVQNHAFLEVSQRDAELFGVGADGAQTQSHAAELLDHLNSVDTRRQMDRHQTSWREL